MDTALRLQVEYLQGQVTALQAAIRGLILTHPDPTRASRMVEHLLEETQARGLASPSATESMLMGLETSPRRLVPSDAQIDRAFNLGG